MKMQYYMYIILLFIASGCNTYKTFYQTTFSSIPDTDISKIYRLNLSDQNLETLPLSASKLSSLRMLDLSGNTDLNLETVFEQLHYKDHIEVLILDHLTIDKLPKSISAFTSLKHISLAYNPNLDLKHTLELLKTLPIVFLNLQGNQITDLPEEIAGLHHLRDLNLSYNKIHNEKSYEYLGTLPKLYSVWIDHNEFDELPKTIGTLDQIRFLYIDHNHLKTLPKEMSQLKTWVIHAGYNNFDTLPEVFTDMQSLFMVHINHNQISTIPKAYETKKYPLAGLILDGNPLPSTEKKKAQKLFKSFFLLSFEQK